MSRITIEPAALRHLGSQFENAHLDKRAVLFFDHNTERLFAEAIESQLHEQGFELRKIVVPASERAKSLRVAEKVYGELIAAKVDRSWSVVGVGGGVVGDLAGFVAASFMRGLPLINVPTTLLAMADSAIGGKVAVNHPRGKNLIGFFYEPLIVSIDPNFLKTLPSRDVRSGLAEVLKYALIGDEKLLRYFESHLEKMTALQSPFIDQAIRTSVKAKTNIVKQDPHETNGLRALLNFGHTFGHAMESAAGYGKLRHGEAVLIGMLAAAVLSHHRKSLGESELHRITEIVLRLKPEKKALKPYFLDISETLLEAEMQTDKKKSGKQLRFVLLHGIGKAELSEEVISSQEIRQAITETKRLLA